MPRSSSLSALVPEAPRPGHFEEANPTQVLKAASELFVARPNHTIREVTVFRELALNLLPQTDVSVRRAMAGQLVWHPDTPREVLIALAGDTDAFTAFPLLHHLEDLPDDVLITQIERGPDGLRKTIAERLSLTEAVVEALLRLSGAGVIESLLQREDIAPNEAQISALLKRPDGKTGFGAMLRYKTRFSEGLLMGNYLYLNAQERNQAVAAAELLALVDLGRHGGHPGAAKPVRPVFKPAVLSILKECAMAPGHDLFAAELSYALRLPRGFIDRIIQEDDGHTLTLGLKALGFEVTVASAILVRQLGERLTESQLKDLVRFYRKTSQGAAMLLLGRWIAVEAPDQARAMAATDGARSDRALSHLVDTVRDERQGAATTWHRLADSPSPVTGEVQRPPLRASKTVSPHQESNRPGARGTSLATSQDRVWQEIEDIESILKFG